MENELKAFQQLFMIQKSMTKLFLHHLLIRLQRDVSDFDGEMFLEQLYIVQQNLPSYDAGLPEDQVSAGLSIWGDYVTMSEEAIAEGRRNLDE